ncbi:hypothetical protein GYMLUDRAFT_77296 [Collybiopsis luxurians FD-317 M1]|uniref:Laccase n=1 Tax=Collybiopsis luxurians FD-317 M1 TaxID=944289 RepID=A0A0D0C7X6_9AGAR|nr:hypothetical protein GYMLUDRAFT_77296 [Collybiopsis luxurians FD-317 M1]
MLSVQTLLLLGLIGAALAAIGPVTDLHILSSFIQPDGFNRSGVLAEGVFPGPLIRGNKGDNFQINVINELTNGTMLKTTSIHWHGLFQKSTNWADGAFVTQCPIASGNSFLYNFNVPDQAAMSRYHSHLSTQYCDGLRGALVIYDPEDPYASLYDVDDESTVITLADWQPNATLINGLGRYTNGTAAPLAVINVVQGKRYRFRLVAISCDPNYIFSIDGHSFTVIEADGVNHAQVAADSIQIFAGQRYSFILNATQNVDNYWVRALPSFPPGADFSGGKNSAILRYQGAPEAEPTTSSTAHNQLQETSLVPAEAYPDVDLDLIFGFEGGKFYINDTTFVSPKYPVLLQILSGTTSATDLLPKGSVYGLPLNKTIQITFNATAAAPFGGPHPIHLHGHTFDVIRSAGSSFDNYINPPRRDVVSSGGITDNVTIRFRTDNPGPCNHIDWHLEAGFAAVFAEDVGDVPTVDPVPDAWKALCPIYDSLTPDQLGGQ